MAHISVWYAIYGILYQHTWPYFTHKKLSIKQFGAVVVTTHLLRLHENWWHNLHICWKSSFRLFEMFGYPVTHPCVQFSQYCYSLSFILSILFSIRLLKTYSFTLSTYTSTCIAYFCVYFSHFNWRQMTRRWKKNTSQKKNVYITMMSTMKKIACTTLRISRVKKCKWNAK